MANYKMTATIWVLGAKTKEEAKNILQIALDDYEDMNPGSPVIVIEHNAVKRAKKEEVEKLF